MLYLSLVLWVVNGFVKVFFFSLSNVKIKGSTFICHSWNVGECDHMNLLVDKGQQVFDIALCVRLEGLPFVLNDK